MDRFTGLLLGTAVGDSLGLPREGLSPRRAARLYPGPLRQRLIARHGMPSDDTEHACMTAQALLATGDDERAFAKALAWKLRWWLVALPPAVGFGTLRALVRAWLGFSPSGVRSAGNGAAMRAPIIGAWFDDLDRVERFVAASTEITHRDPRAHAGALAIAIAAHHAARGTEARVLDDIRARVTDPELLAGLDRDWPDGVSGYVHHTVPACLRLWLRSPRDFERAVGGIILLGGDTDTTGAIVGALVGATGAEIPREWLAIVDAPRSLSWIRRLGGRLAERGRPLRLAWPLVPLRNLVFLVIGLRRLLPPYT